jgi:hypothetical protein
MCLFKLTTQIIMLCGIRELEQLREANRRLMAEAARAPTANGGPAAHGSRDGAAAAQARGAAEAAAQAAQARAQVAEADAALHQEEVKRLTGEGTWLLEASRSFSRLVACK